MESGNTNRGAIISQEEKQTNPLLRVVANKIRNLNKKISQIQHIESLDRKSLKQAQINKLSQKEEVLREIVEQEEFVARYKAILLENNLIYDKVDDLIKISALLTVGNRIQREEYCPEEAKNLYLQIFKPVFKYDVPEHSQISDQIVRVYHLLDKYLAHPGYYTQCKDYMTYQEEIDSRNLNNKEGNYLLPQPKILSDHTSDQLTSLPQKVSKLSLASQVFNIEEGKAILQKQINNLDMELTAQKSLSFCEKVDSMCNSEEKASTKPDSLDSKPEKDDDLDQELLIIANNIRKETFDFTRKEDALLESGSTSQLNTNQEKKKRKRNRRKNNHFEVEAMRKCSDTSLEPTPEKFQVKKQKYRQKYE